MSYHLSLGSNLGARRANVRRARSLLEASGIRVRRASSLYLTEPVGYRNQPWFVNQVLLIERGGEPRELLTLVKKIERIMKRRPGRRHGPRSIDIDILLAGRRVLDTSDLSLPHPSLASRRFVLVPLAEISPRAVHPVLGKTVIRLLREVEDGSLVRRIKEFPSCRHARPHSSRS